MEIGVRQFSFRFANDPISVIGQDNIFCPASQRAVWSRAVGNYDNAGVMPYAQSVPLLVTAFHIAALCCLERKPVPPAG